MENSAGTGGTIGRSIPELARLVDALDGHERLGICLDSCHLYASGYDVTDPAALDSLVDEVAATIGLDRLRALHINDSETPLGSNRDRHADVLKGEMGKGMGVFLAHPAFQDLAAYLETPGPDGHGPVRADLTRVRRLHKTALAARS
jgi:deoxyribonuclease-4